MSFIRIDDAVIGDNKPISSFETDRLVENDINSVIQRTQEGNWASLVILDTIENQGATPTTRQVNLGSHPERPAGLIIPYNPMPTETRTTVEGFVENVTNADCQIRWYIVTSNGLEAVTDEETVAALTPRTEKIWNLPLTAIQGGARRPHTVYFYMQVTSDTSTDVGDQIVYSLADQDYRRFNVRGVQYTQYTALVDNNAHFQNILLYQIVDIINQDNIGGKSTAWDQNPAFTDAPYIVIQRHENVIRWYPEMLQFPYPAANSSIQLGKMGEVRLYSLSIRPTLGRPTGPLSSPDALKRSLSGGQAARGGEFMQVWRAQDEIVYGSTPILHWGPQVVSKFDYADNGGSLWTFAGAPTSWAMYQFLGDSYRTITEWRIDNDSDFGGDVADAQRRSIEITPFWALLAHSQWDDTWPVSFRLSFLDATGTPFNAVESSIDMPLFTSKSVREWWFSFGGSSIVTNTPRTFHSNSGMFARPDVIGLINKTINQPILKRPTGGLIATHLRLEVKATFPLRGVEPQRFVFIDLGTTIKGATSSSNSGRTINDVLGAP